LGAEKRFVKSFRLLLILLVLILLLAAAFLLLPKLLTGTGRSDQQPGGNFLSDHRIDDLLEVHVKNQYDEYSLWQRDGGIVFADLPVEQTNLEYMDFLMDAAARVEYETLVSKDESDLSLYGLDNPGAEVTIRYSGGETLSLSFGEEETISRGSYFTVKGESDVYLMRQGLAVWFLFPLTRYISFDIVPSMGFQSPLSAIKKLTLSGHAFPRTIVIEEVRSDNPDEMRDAASFGVATHLVRLPVLHEIDQKECIAVFGSLEGLLNKDVLAYNCTDEELAAFGFNDPWVKAEYDFLRNKNAETERIVLRAARYNGGYILVRDDQQVVHRIENEAFIETKYERLVMRWFLTPFVTDLTDMELHLGGRNYAFRFSGETNRELAVSLDGKSLPIELFRKFYTLLISAANDGMLLEQPVPKTELLMALSFSYKDSQKKPDTMNLYSAGSRRLNVEVNGITEFAMLRRYITVAEHALEALSQGSDFPVDW
jgi:hypothetical protein